VLAEMERYLSIRLFGAPAVLLTLAGFGALRGLQDMRTPLWITGVVTAINIVLDPLLIFGTGPVPAFGVAGAAAASVAAQWVGALWGVAAVRSKLGFSPRIPWQHAPALLVVGWDLFLRTALLTVFLLLSTRVATRLGAAEGAAHQVVRQVWLFSAFLLDAYATAAQSLVGWFLGASKAALARRVASVACAWGIASGLLLTLAMLLLQDAVARAMVPVAAQSVFPGAWLLLALAQPLNAVSFVTDGIHWGTRDYAYLRNAMFLATLCGGAGLTLVDDGPRALEAVWAVTAGWIFVRAALGTVRVWPGIGRAPLRSA